MLPPACNQLLAGGRAELQPGKKTRTASVFGIFVIIPIPRMLMCRSRMLSCK